MFARSYRARCGTRGRGRRWRADGAGRQVHAPPSSQAAAWSGRRRRVRPATRPSSRRQRFLARQFRSGPRRPQKQSRRQSGKHREDKQHGDERPSAARWLHGIVVWLHARGGCADQLTGDGGFDGRQTICRIVPDFDMSGGCRIDRRSDGHVEFEIKSSPTASTSSMVRTGSSRSTPAHQWQRGALTAAVFSSASAVISAASRRLAAKSPARSGRIAGSRAQAPR